jgi:hypothetical protein
MVDRSKGTAYSLRDPEKIALETRFVDQVRVVPSARRVKARRLQSARFGDESTL